MRYPVPPFASGGLVLSYTCSAACAHCMYACTPKWKSGWISDEHLDALLQQLSRTIVPAPGGPETIGLSHGLHFTGGEPFLKYDLLARAVEKARRLEIPSLFVETNGFWAANDKDTREKLEHLKTQGLRGIMISVNPFYLEFVPFERTERAIRISLDVFGRNTYVYQVEYFRQFKELGIKGTLSLDEYLAKEGIADFARRVEFFLSGRAPFALEGRFERFFRKGPAGLFLREGCQPPFLREWHNHVDPDGNYMPGFCGGISLGDARQLDRLMEEGVDVSGRPVLGALMKEDLAGLLTYAKEQGYTERKEGYFSRCHLCADIRRHLVRNGDYPELQPREFYEHLGTV